MAEISVLSRSWESLRGHEHLKTMGLCQDFPEFSAILDGGRCSECMSSSGSPKRIHGAFDPMCGGVTLDNLCEKCIRGKAKDLVDAILVADVPARLLESLSTLDFEGQKTFAMLFEAMLDVDGSSEVSGRFGNYLQSNPELLSQLLEGFGSPDISLHCGTMLRSCARYPHLISCLLEQGALLKCIELAACVGCFDISCEAFALLHQLLTQTEVLGKHLETHAETFFERYRLLLESTEYTIQRQALKFLGRLLLERDFMDIMTSYVKDLRFLKIHMNLLRSSSPRIQHDNFHIFKMFVANPWKPDNITRTLLRNQDGLVRLLESYNGKIDGDDAFKQDLPAVMQMLRSMSEPIA